MQCAARMELSVCPCSTMSKRRCASVKSGSVRSLEPPYMPPAACRHAALWNLRLGGRWSICSSHLNQRRWPQAALRRCGVGCLRWHWGASCMGEGMVCVG